MSAILASVNNLQEAMMLKALNIGIIDLKQPSEGALGALDCEQIREIVKDLAGVKPVSATIGDLPMQADIIYPAIEKTAKTGVDFVNIGFFPGNDWNLTTIQLAPLAQQYKLIAVLFADTQPDWEIITLLGELGFKGVMLDTMNKQNGSLTGLMNNRQIRHFIALAKGYHLLTGLAGSLTQQDFTTLSSLGADYIGFRGALCREHNRVAQIDPSQVLQLLEIQEQITC